MVTATGKMVTYQEEEEIDVWTVSCGGGGGGNLRFWL